MNSVLVNATFPILGLVLASQLTAAGLNDEVCDATCQLQIDEGNRYVANLHADTTKTTDELLKRLIHLESQQTALHQEMDFLFTNLSRLESDLTGNVSAIYKRIKSESDSLWLNLSTNLNSVKAELEDKIGIGGNGNSPIIKNMTLRMDHMENVRMTNLTRDNAIWRRNFRIVNATLEKLRKNNCACVKSGSIQTKK